MTITLPPEEADFQTALAIKNIARLMPDDLPDGMADEILDAHEAYRENRTNEGKRDFISDIQEICEEWGFPFA